MVNLLYASSKYYDVIWFGVTKKKKGDTLATMSDAVLCEGCCIYLSRPQLEDLAEWASWFNDRQITQNLGDHESKDHSPESQLRYWKDEESKGRLFAMARNSSAGLMGVLTCIPLSENNMSVSMVFPKVLPKAPFAALEAIALFVEHVFSEFEVDRISVGQRYPTLKSWSQRLFLVGFQYEGLEQSGFTKGNAVDDIVRMGITREYFNLVRLQRQGKLWPGDLEIGLLWNRLNILLKEEIREKNLTDFFVSTINKNFEAQKATLASIQNPT